MGVRKVNLSDLSGSLSHRGRARFADPELAEALLAMIADNEPFIWETAVVSGKTEKAIEASKAKWRNRATSVLASLETNYEISIRWTSDNEMVITPKG